MPASHALGAASPRPVGAALLVAAALLAGCASPRTRVVLLPQEDGRPSAVVVHNVVRTVPDVTLSRPYQRATARESAWRQPLLADEVAARAVEADYPLLFSLAPPRPSRYTLYFAAGGTQLTAESQQVLEQALADALARAGGDIVLIGHTDTKGAGPLNDSLSAERARGVRQLFIARQFPADRIESAGRGERELAVPTADEVDEPRNRRVTIEVR